MIRFQRIGRRNNPSFRLIVTPRTTGPHGKSLEILGSWNPKTKATSVKK
ncbi:MAG: 30S ribosomal protein S16, partial [Candidatus Paceibacteria bacterium]